MYNIITSLYIMKPIIFYDNWLPKLIKVYCITLTIFCFTTADDANTLDDRTIRHESLHVIQWLETTISMLLLASLLVCMSLIPWWCTLLSIVIFYAFYGLEWLIKFLILIFKANYLVADAFDEAYHQISVEYEAFENTFNKDYNKTRNLFAWTKYIFKLDYGHNNS